MGRWKPLIAGIALGSLWLTRQLPSERLAGEARPPAEDTGAERSEPAAPQL